MPLVGAHSHAVPMKQVSKGNYLSKTLLKHNVVFSEGQRGDSAFILTKGKIEISGTVDGRKKVFAILSPISLFGEMALILEEGTRTATAIALEDSEVIVFTRDDLDDFMKDAPQVISSVLTVLVSRLKSTTKKAMRVPSVPMSIVRMLDIMANNGTMNLKYDHLVRMVSEMMVTSPETVEKYLLGIVEKGIIEIKGGKDEQRRIFIQCKDPLNQVLQQHANEKKRKAKK